MLECSLVTKFGSTLERGEDGVTPWELGNSMLRDIKGSTLKEVELVSTFWEGGLRSLEAGVFQQYQHNMIGLKIFKFLK